MTYQEAFIILREKVRQFQLIPVEATTAWERAQEEALIIALETMREWSGSFPPDEMLTQEPVPTRRTL